MRTLSASLLALLAAASLEACTKDNSEAEKKISELTQRVEKLEEAQRGFDEVASFVRPIIAQQKAQRAQQEASEPDPDARFAVDITGNQAVGPAGAAVTVVEAWDFA